VVLVLIDGLRYDTAIDSSVMPTLAGLRTQGAWAKMHSRPMSFSGSGYTVLLTGAWPEISDGPTFNKTYADLTPFTQDNLFSAAARSGLKTAVSGFNWFEKLIFKSDVDATFFTSGEDASADRQVLDAALPWLAEPGAFQFIMVHLDQVDYAGHHEGGPLDPQWNAAAHRADDLLAEITSQLDLHQDTLIVLSDHGHIDRGGHGGQEAIVLQEPFLLAGAGVKPGEYGDMDMADVAPTLAALLGANLPASAQGQVLAVMLNLPPQYQSVIRQAEIEQQSQLLQAYSQAMGNPIENISISEGDNVVHVYQSNLESVRSSRLQSEQLIRVAIALVLLLVLGWLLIRTSKADWPWLALGGLMYLVLFHLCYRFVLGRTFSYSPLTGQNDMILAAGGTSLVAVLITWLVVTWRIKLFHRNAREAAYLSIKLSLWILYMLLFPIAINFSLNGLFTTWHLPDFLTHFLALLATIQLIFVAAGGILLAGITAAYKNWKTAT
jgi:hypothetical protein